MCACIHMHALGLITDSVKYLWEQGNTELNVESVVPKVFNHCIVLYCMYWWGRPDIIYNVL